MAIILVNSGVGDGQGGRMIVFLYLLDQETSNSASEERRINLEYKEKPAWVIHYLCELNLFSFVNYFKLQFSICILKRTEANLW